MVKPPLNMFSQEDNDTTPKFGCPNTKKKSIDFSNLMNLKALLAPSDVKN